MESSREFKNEVTNLCLMAKDSDSDEKVKPSNLECPPSYDELQYCYQVASRT